MTNYISSTGTMLWNLVEDFCANMPPKFERVHSPNYNNFLNPMYIVIHYTAGGSAASTVDWFMQPENKVSAHFVIERNGDITQCVSLNNRAWHAGSSEYKGVVGLNAYSVGIELANWGPLRRDLQTGFYYPYAQTNPVYDIPQNRVIGILPQDKESIYVYWERFPAEQLFSLALLCYCLCQSLPIQELLSHAEISPGRKIDPGPAFPLDVFKRLVKISRQR